MSRINTQVYTYIDEQVDVPAALFKIINVSPKHNDFLQDRLKTINYCIMSIKSGEFDWNINGEMHHVTAHDLLIICPGVEMLKDYKPVEFGEFYKISLNPDYYFGKGHYNRFKQFIQKPEIADILTELNSKKVVVFKNCMDQKVIFCKIEQEFLKKELGYINRIGALIEELLIELFRTLKKGDCSADCLITEFENLKQILNNDVARHWTVKEMAQYTNMGVTQFSYKMKLLLGFSPFDFLIYLRINKAANMLQNTDFPITQIALETGFYSSQHFSFTFKKILGTTPSSFRKQA